MLSIDISNLSILLSQLHIVIIQLIVIDYLIDLLYPLVVHKHLVVTVGDGFLSGYELLVLGLEFVSEGLYVGFLVQGGGEVVRKGL